MRIIHFLNHTRRANGHVELAIDLACEQAAFGHDVAIVSGPGDFADRLREHGVEFVEIPGTDGKFRLATMTVAFALAARRLKPEIVNAHMVAAALAARGAQIAARFRLVTTVHNSFDPQAALMKVGERVIAVSDAVNREMAGKGVPAGRLRTVRNGTVGGRRRARLPAKPMALRRPSLCTVAGLHPRKGVGDLLNAFEIAAKSFPDAHLYIVGEGPDRRSLEERAAALSCGGNIHFLGYRADPRDVLASSDIFVLASHAEPFGLVLCEARQMGCAIISTNVGGAPEAIGGGAKGVLVPPADPAALALAIERLLGDAPLRRRLAAAAQEDLYEISVERMCLDTLNVYRELVSEETAALQAAELQMP